MLPGRSRKTCMIENVFPGLDRYLSEVIGFWVVVYAWTVWLEQALSYTLPQMTNGTIQHVLHRYVGGRMI